MAAVGLAVKDVPALTGADDIRVWAAGGGWAWSCRGLAVGRHWTLVEFQRLSQFVHDLEIPETEDVEAATWTHPTGAQVLVSKFRV